MDFILDERSRELVTEEHRRYTLQMVYFNMLFAVNRRYHPGEKRLLVHGERCPARPERQTELWTEIALRPVDDTMVAEMLQDLVDELCKLAEI